MKKKSKGNSTARSLPNKVIVWSLVAIAIGVPLILSISTSDTYGMPKLTYLHLVTILIAVAWAIEIVNDRRIELIRSPLDLPILTFIAFTGIATLLSINRYQSFFGDFSRYDGFLTYLNYLFLFFVAANHLRDKSSVKTVLYAIVGTSLFISIYGISQHFGYDFFLMEGGADISRSFSTLGNPVFLGAYLVLIIPIAIGLSWAEKDYKRYIFGSAAALGVICLFFTYTRAAWIGFFASAVTLLILAPKFLKGKLRSIPRKKWIAGVGIAIVLLILVISSASYSKYNQLSRVVSETVSVSGSVSTRLFTWGSTMHLIKDRFALGWGPDTFPLVFPKYENVHQIQIEGRNVMTDRSHNEFLQIASGMGLVGLFAYLWIFVVFGYFCLSTLKKFKKGNSYLKIMTAMYFASFIGYLIQIQFSFSVVTVAPIFWMSMGAIFAYSRRVSEEMGVDIGAKKFCMDLHISKDAGNYLVGTTVVIALIFSILTLKPYLGERYYREGIDNNRANGDPNLAINSFRNALKMSPRHEYYIGLAVALKRKGIANKDLKAFEEAIAVLRTAIARNPSERFAYLNLGDVYLALGQADRKYLDDAISIYRQSLKLDPNFALSFKNLGDAFAAEGKESESVKCYERAIYIDPGFTDVYNSLGVYYGKKGNFTKAIELLKTATENDPNSATAFSNLGLAYYKMKDLKNAVAAFQRSYQLNPNNQEIKQALKQLGILK